MRIFAHPSLRVAWAGLVAGAGLLAPFAWPLAVLGVALFFHAARRAPSWQRASVDGLIFGLGASAGGIAWFWDALPLSWLQVPDGPIQPVLVGIAFALSAIALALPFAPLAAIGRLLPAAWWRPLALSLLYALAEWLRLLTFALFFLAPASRFAPDFSIANLGYALTENSLILPIAQAGAAGLAAFLGLIAAALAGLLSRNRAETVVASIALALALGAAYAALPPTPSGATLRTALIATNEPPGTLESPAPVLAALSEAARSHPRLVLLPEGMSLAPFLSEDDRQSVYARLFDDGALIVSSSVVDMENGRQRARLLYEKVGEGTIGYHDKMFFVPIGEYLPPLVEMAFAPFKGKELAGYGSYLKDAAEPGSTLSVASVDGVSVGALMCSELLSPRLYPALAAVGRTQVLGNIANDSWFHGSHLLFMRLRQIARTHALVEHQYMLVASNAAPAYVIDPQGRLVRESASIPDVLVIDVPVR